MWNGGRCTKHKTQPHPFALIDEAEQVIYPILSQRQPDGGDRFARAAPSAVDDIEFALMVTRRLSGSELSHARSRDLFRIEPVANPGPRLMRFLTLTRRARMVESGSFRGAHRTLKERGQRGKPWWSWQSIRRSRRVRALHSPLPLGGRRVWASSASELATARAHLQPHRPDPKGLDSHCGRS
jgi:hypothetical protein